METFEKYIEFWVKHKPSVSDKILFCIYRGVDSPQALQAKLKIAKGNLANCCKGLVGQGKITRHTNGRTVKYTLTAKGEESLKKFLGGAK